MIHEKKLFFGIFLIKNNYQRNSSTLKHALANKNKESIIESRIMRLF